MAKTKITPPIGATGLFQLALPWTADASKAYTVGALRSFAELIKNDIDPVELVYTPAGLSRSVYEEDAALGAVIVTLLNGSSDPIHVPDTYILSYPNMAVVPYSWLVVSASLGDLPDTEDFSLLQQAVATAVSDYIGVEPAVTIHRAQTQSSVTQEQHVQKTAARNAAIKNRVTVYQENRTLRDDLDAAKTRNALLQTTIVNQAARIKELEEALEQANQNNGKT